MAPRSPWLEHLKHRRLRPPCLRKTGKVRRRIKVVAGPLSLHARQGAERLLNLDGRGTECDIPTGSPGWLPTSISQFLARQPELRIPTRTGAVRVSSVQGPCRSIKMERPTPDGGRFIVERRRRRPASVWSAAGRRWPQRRASRPSTSISTLIEVRARVVRTTSQTPQAHSSQSNC